MDISTWIGKTLGFTSANAITLFGGVMALIGILLFGVDQDWPAVACLIISFLTDWWDGCVARFHQGDRSLMSREDEALLTFGERLNYRGVTHLGRALDPFIDKIRFIGLLWTIGLEYVDEGVAVLMTGLAVLLTLVRPAKRLLKLDPGGANFWGKRKVYAEVVFIVALVFGTRPLYNGSNPFLTMEFTPLIISMIGTVTLFLASASLYTHIENGYIYFVCTRSSSSPLDR